MDKPQLQIITIWRIMLTLAVIVPAVLICLFLRVGSFAWTLAAAGLAALFLAAYLVYLPLFYKKMSFGVSDGKLVLKTGVFTTRVVAMPVPQIQFVTVIRPVLGRVFGLASVIAVAPGGRVAVRGLKAADAERLALVLNPGCGGGGGEP